MTTNQFALALAHVEKTIRIGTLECVWLAAIVDSPGLTYNELAERYGISRRDKPNGPGSRLRYKELITSKYDVMGKFRHYPTDLAATVLKEATTYAEQ